MIQLTYCSKPYKTVAYIVQMDTIYAIHITKQVWKVITETESWMRAF